MGAYNNHKHFLLLIKNIINTKTVFKLCNQMFVFVHEYKHVNVFGKQTWPVETKRLKLCNVHNMVCLQSSWTILFLLYISLLRQNDTRHIYVIQFSVKLHNNKINERFSSISYVKRNEIFIDVTRLTILCSCTCTAVLFGKTPMLCRLCRRLTFIRSVFLYIAQCFYVRNHSQRAICVTWFNCVVMI